MVTGREGTTIGGYRLTRWLGRGGAGDVYLAEGPARVGRVGPVAVKIIAGTARDPTARALARQAREIASIDHPNILPVYATGQEDDAIFIVMAYAPGCALAAQIRAPDAPDAPDAVPAGAAVALPLPGALAARLIADAASALHAAHAHGVVHGDLTPANLFVRGAPDGTPQVAVTDFGQGIVVWTAAEAAANGASWASDALACAAPEQLTGTPLPASDQYALATIAYLLLTGRYPFGGDGRALGLAIVHEPPPPPSRFNRAISPDAEQVLRRALAKVPGERYPDVAAFAQALCAALGEADAPPTAQDMAQGMAQAAAAAPALPAASFTPTGHATIDRALTWLDGVSGGRAGGLVHLASYLMSGGFAAVVNLATLYLVYNRLALPVPDQIHYIIAYAIAAEVSIIANFLPNDSLTFRHMAGHARPWWQRLLRFHSTTLLGVCVTLGISYTMHYGFGLPVVAGQAVAIVISLAFNFTMHHVWTYRRLRARQQHA